ncbi:mini-chromosome maintenance complex-binding protein [Uranotaenia lowii]|uniref:mini-chromosome maintenance complex-binding protein n=1 Tax=Uranotaenia lowii TaxID=190385 RepID=UPI002478FC84|nr:mini-chromosome maintenance complex-binding protein [Uranotaenia lowii]
MLDLLSWTPEYFSANEASCVELLSKPEVRNRIPLLNCTQLHELQDQALVRFRGMIQDMQDPECYLERYEVRRKSDKTLVREQNGKYRDILVMSKGEEEVDFKGSNNKYGERRSMFVISIPGYNSWAVESERKMNPTLTNGTENGTTSNAKRSLEDEDAMEIEQSTEHGQDHVFKKPMIPNGVGGSNSKSVVNFDSSKQKTQPKVLSAEYLLNSPIPERPSKACLVILYSNIDEATLNTLVDVVGFLSVDPALDGSTDQMDDFEDEMSEHQAINPPPSLIPRIHAIDVLKLNHLNPMIQSASQKNFQESVNEATFKDLQNLLTQCLFGDRVAADYLLCHLLSTVYIRNEVESLGQFSLNLSNIPAQALPNYTADFYGILELLLPASHYFPMTLENMNSVQFVPKKDYTTNKLTSGLLQLAAHTHLLLDETRLQTGKLESGGVEAVQNIAHLIRTQKLKYNFQYYQLEFNTDVPVLVMSEGRSMLPTNCQVPILPDPDTVPLIGETIKAGKHFVQPKLADIRRFLTLQRIQQFDMKDFDPEVISNDFLQMRRDNAEASAEDLHSLLVLARLVCLARGKNSMDQESWEYAKQLELERKRRVELFVKRKNEQ